MSYAASVNVVYHLVIIMVLSKTKQKLQAAWLAKSTMKVKILLCNLDKKYQNNYGGVEFILVPC